MSKNDSRVVKTILCVFRLVDMPDFGVFPIGCESLSQDESESTFENKSGLADDLKFLASMPELCDVTFLVGETREPVCAVKVHANSYIKRADKNNCLQFPLFAHAGYSSSSISHFSQNFVSTAGLTTTEKPAKPSARSRKQTSPLPQTILGAFVEPPK